MTPSRAPARHAARDRRRASPRGARRSACITARCTPSAASTTDGVFVLEVAARPIGGLCARALRFESAIGSPQIAVSLEELLLRHALGEAIAGWTRESAARRA